MTDQVEVAGTWRVPRWITIVVLLYLLLGSAGGLWFGIDRVTGW